MPTPATLLPNFESHMIGSELREYSAALWKHWRAGITGGSATAIVTAVAVTGHVVAPEVGVAFVAGTILVASFDAWRSERRLGQPRIHILRAEPRFFALAFRIRLTNPDARPLSFEPDWSLDVRKATGEVATGLKGRIVGEIRPLQQAEQFNVDVMFDGYNGILEESTLSGASISLSARDIYGREARAEHVLPQ